MRSVESAPAGAPRKGRGARRRILEAAATVFYEEGIVNTSVERLAEAAHVSKRTLYDHFPSKALIVDEYLRQSDEAGVESERVLDRTELSPRDRLVAMFQDTPGGVPLRGCAFHNASVEAAGTMPSVRDAVVHHKAAFLANLAAATAEAGARDPEGLAAQLAVLFEGSRALTTSMDARTPMAAARAAAEVLIDAAVPALITP